MFVLWLFVGARLKAGRYQGAPLPRAERGARAWDAQGCPSLPVSSAQALGLALWVCSEEEEGSVSEPHVGPSRAWWSLVCLRAPAPGPRVHFVFLERGLLSRAAVCSAVVKSGFATSGRPAFPKVKANGGNSGAGDRQRHCCLRGTGSCLPATRMVSCPLLCGWLRVKGFSFPPCRTCRTS